MKCLLTSLLQRDILTYVSQNYMSACRYHVFIRWVIGQCVFSNSPGRENPQLADKGENSYHMTKHTDENPLICPQRGVSFQCM